MHERLPQVVLLLTLSPADRRVYHVLRRIKDDPLIHLEDEGAVVAVGNQEYVLDVEDGHYKHRWKPPALAGDVVVWAEITIGQHFMLWADVAVLAAELEEWGRGVAARHECEWQIWVGSNYR